MRKGVISIWVVCFLMIAFAVVVNRPTAPVPINSELELEGSGVYDNDYYVGEQNQILIVRILDTDGGGDITNFWCNITTTDPAINFTDYTGNIGDLPYDSTPGSDDYLWDPSVTWNYFKFTFDINNSATPGEHYVILKLNYTNSAAVRRMDVIFSIKIIIGPFTKTLYVGGTGLGNYTHIQYAIENASDGDTVFVFNDSAPYYENVVVNKTINLIGENRDTTIIDGGGSRDVVNITADWVNVTGFTITNSSSEPNNAGLEIYNVWNCSIYHNNISYIMGISIYLNNSWGCIINNNYLSHNNYGIYLVSSYDNLIYHNNIIGNTNQSYDDTYNGNQWDNGYPHGGNYWSDYNGVDENSGPNQDQPGSDGIGDTPYIIDSDSQDNYPLIEPWVIDDSPPTIELVSPSNNSVIRPGKNIKLSISDPHLDEVLYSLNSSANQALVFPFEINTTEWKDGDCIIEIYAADFYNNTNITWFNFTIDSISPSITLNSPGNNSIIQRGTFLNFSIIDINLLHVNYSLNGGSNTSLSEPFNISTTSWPDEEYTIQINALDKAGNKDTKWYFFTIDSTPPDIAEIMVTLFPMESWCYVNISVNASDSTQIYNMWVNITDPNGITIGNFSMNYDSVTCLFYLNQTCEFFGEYQLVIWANDTIGNWISNTGYFDGFTLPGAPTNLTATAGDGYIVITWCAPVSNGGSPITIYRIYRGKISGNVSFLTGVYNSSHYIDTDVIEGETYYYKVRAVTTIGVGPMSNEASATCKEKSQPDEGLPWWLWVIIAIVIALIVIFIIYMIFSKKKEQQPPQPPPSSPQ